MHHQDNHNMHPHNETLNLSHQDLNNNISNQDNNSLNQPNANPLQPQDHQGPPVDANVGSGWILFPWDDKDAKPYFVNPEGFEWWIDKDCTQWAHKDMANGNKGLKNMACFFIRKDGKVIERALINDKQQLVYNSQSLDGMCTYIDVLKFKAMFPDDENYIP